MGARTKDQTGLGAGAVGTLTEGRRVKACSHTTTYPLQISSSGQGNQSSLGGADVLMGNRRRYLPTNVASSAYFLGSACFFAMKYFSKYIQCSILRCHKGSIELELGCR